MSQKKTYRPLQLQDHFLSKESFTIDWDPSQQIGATVFPDSLDLNAYYKSTNYASHQDQKKGWFGRAYRLAQRLMFYRKLNLLTSCISKSGRVLDYGCGVGDFMIALTNKGYDTVGVEPSPSAREVVAAKKLTVFPSLEGLRSASRFDAITLWHVLEHLENPSESLQHFYEKLQPKGYLILALPNPNSWDAHHYKSFWAAWDVPRHLWHFTEEGIMRVATEAGFVHRKTYALPLDAFYVSLLSEGYKGSSLKWMRALWNGIRSTGHGILHNNYSSQIYLFQKA